MGQVAEPVRNDKAGQCSGGVAQLCDPALLTMGSGSARSCFLG